MLYLKELKTSRKGNGSKMIIMADEHLMTTYYDFFPSDNLN
jgi:hypothetical protein